MTEMQAGDHYTVVCRRGYETAAAMHMSLIYGSALSWVIIGDARVKAESLFMFNQSHVWRRVQGREAPSVFTSQLHKHHRFSRAMVRMPDD